MRPDLLILMLCADILPFTQTEGIVIEDEKGLFSEKRQEYRKTKEEIKKENGIA